MVYLAHSAYAQLGALWMGCVGWTFSAMALGLIQWRVWHVTDSEVISSGVAWVGIWKACFNSHTLVTPDFRVMYCRSIGLTDAFTPPEIVAAQVLMLLALFVGLFGLTCSIYGLRNVSFSLVKSSLIRPAFITAGSLCSLAAVMSLVPLLWNLSSVVTNQTIPFPPEFHIPPAPNSQNVGCAIGVGILGTVLMIISGIIFCMYRFPERSELRSRPAETEEVQPGPSRTLMTSRGRENPGFEVHEDS
ncbi:hypothetical protein LDENG_00025060 [Lucifuga dentata]|nr:hypothetical protein LDENG_00025060 [Lucifuga dentata]